MIDVSSSTLAFLGILLSYIGYPWAEILAGLVIGAYVVKVGLWIVKDV
jgi:divalent metal cation (Fe/Co/Zn/Cd) transporter